MTNQKGRLPLERYSPDKQLAIFSKTRFFGFLMISIIGHSIFLAATSMQYIQDTYIDPEGAELRKKKEKEALVAAAKSTVMMESGKIGSSNVKAMVAAETNAAMRAETFAAGTNASATAPTNENPFLERIVKEMPKDGRPTDSKILKDLTHIAKSNEIPVAPPATIKLRIEETD